MRFKIIIAVIAAAVLALAAILIGDDSSRSNVPQPGPTPQSQDAYKGFKIPN